MIIWHVDADPEKTASVVRSIKSKISYQAYIMIYEAAISDAEDKLDTIYRFMVLDSIMVLMLWIFFRNLWLCGCLN